MSVAQNRREALCANHDRLLAQFYIARDNWSGSEPGSAEETRWDLHKRKLGEWCDAVHRLRQKHEQSLERLKARRSS